MTSPAQEVITNPHVISIMRSVLKDEQNLSEQLQEAIFEPRMTRSKLKDALEKSQVSGEAS